MWILCDWFADEVVCACFGRAPYAWFWSIKAERSIFLSLLSLEKLSQILSSTESLSSNWACGKTENEVKYTEA